MTASATGPVAAEMLRRLNASLAPTRIELIDESDHHRGHAGHDGRGESHFALQIESPAFAGQSRVQRQRAIYAALGELMDERVHALSIRATAPVG
ncbi:MAG: BolA family transcriptional regulator [Sphingomonas sp.]|uniref:BolA family protein n=1 Tax=Sphingomonas sp. TaxID=28214 RepID=UPI00182F0A2A|nr:BolA family protein [Sphingomonas sp.]MBA3667144.1 BolA family transcriptional regulator [Sphingomonas sp.]